MSSRIVLAAAACAAILFTLPAGAGEPAGAPSEADARVAALEAMCAEAGPAMEARHAERPLFDRVGGREGLREVVEGTVSRHLHNARISRLMEGVDAERLVSLVTDFLVVGTGGEGEYRGRDMKSGHAHLGIDNGDFLAAGADLEAAMVEAGWGEAERQELLCAFVSLRDQVVTR